MKPAKTLWTNLSTRKNEFSDEETEYVQVRDPVEDALQKCFDQVIRPVAYFLCLLGWRPFPFILAHHHHWEYRCLDLLYPALVCCSLGLSYFFGLYYAMIAERTSLISEYIMGAVVSAVLWCYGMWFFRREEGKAFEELSALIETVFLYSTTVFPKASQNRLTQALINYLISAGLALFLFMALGLWIGISLSTQIAQDTQASTLQFTLAVIAISIGYVAENAIFVATIVIYWIICRLHMRYLDGIRDKLMKRNISLGRAIRDIGSVKKLINDTNQGWAVAVSFLAFSLAVEAVFIQVRFFEGEKYRFEFVQAGFSFAFTICLFFASMFPASLVCWKSERLKGMSWKLRAEQHYRKATPEQLDSFLMFCSSAKLYAKVMGLPVWKEYLYSLVGIVLVVIFFLWRVGFYSLN